MKSSVSPSERSHIVLCLTQSEQVNWEDVARAAEFKTPKYARDTWAIVRNKLAAAGGDGTASPAKTPARNKASKETPSRKRKAIEGMASFGVMREDLANIWIDPIEDDQEPAVDPEPKPKKKARKSKVKVEEVQTDEEEEATAATPKPELKQNIRKHARKPKAQKEADEVDAEEDNTAATFKPKFEQQQAHKQEARKVKAAVHEPERRSSEEHGTNAVSEDELSDAGFDAAMFT